MIFSKIDNTLYCSFTGRIDESVCSSIEQELSRYVNEFKTNCEGARLVFDLDGVIFISSAFLRICLIQLKAFDKDHFTVTNVTETIYKVFCVSGFNEMMNIIAHKQSE